MGWGFYKICSSGVGVTFFLLFFFGFPVFCSENHKKYGLHIINRVVVAGEYYGILRPFYHKQNKNMTWKSRHSQFYQKSLYEKKGTFCFFKARNTLAVSCL